MRASKVLVIYSFNSRSREGATVAREQGFSDLYVSIHAPVRERPPYRVIYFFLGVSIHAPVRERQEDDVD